VVQMTATGWRIISNPPVRFRRAKGMLPLPAPVSGGDLDALRMFVNIGTDADWHLFVAWLLASFRPEGPYPLLVLHGEQGSAKSTTARIARMILDPNVTPLRADPRDARDVMIAATNGWLLAFDNLSVLRGWLSDALCRLSTEGGFSTRELYTDQDEVL